MSLLANARAPHAGIVYDWFHTLGLTKAYDWLFSNDSAGPALLHIAYSFIATGAVMFVLGRLFRNPRLAKRLLGATGSMLAAAGITYIVVSRLGGIYSSRLVAVTVLFVLPVFIGALDFRLRRDSVSASKLK